MMEIWTGQISHWRMILAKGVELVDITAKSGIKCFAPEYELVMQYKDGQIGEEEYTRLYIEKMRKSFLTHQVAWQELLRKDRVAYCCYCRPDQYCHRHIFVDLLCKYLDSKHVVYKRMGELR